MLFRSPEETNRYVFRILALKQLIGNAPKYGFIIPEIDAYQQVPSRSMTLNQSVPNLAQFAIDQGTNYKMLKILNPWLRDRKLTIKEGRSYTIQLPVTK